MFQEIDIQESLNGIYWQKSSIKSGKAYIIVKALQFIYKGYAKGFKSVNITYVVLRGSTLNFSLRATDSGGEWFDFDIQTRFDSLKEEYTKEDFIFEPLSYMKEQYVEMATNLVNNLIIYQDVESVDV